MDYTLLSLIYVQPFIVPRHILVYGGDYWNGVRPFVRPFVRPSVHSSHFSCLYISLLPLAYTLVTHTILFLDINTVSCNLTLTQNVKVIWENGRQRHPPCSPKMQHYFHFQSTEMSQKSFKSYLYMIHMYTVVWPWLLGQGHWVQMVGFEKKWPILALCHQYSTLFSFSEYRNVSKSFQKLFSFHTHV